MIKTPKQGATDTVPAPKPSKYSMDEGMSLFLDVLRCGAAVTVLLGHVTQRYFSSGLPDCTGVAVAAVGVFFVLSGFVIQATVHQREAEPRKYFVARFARMYSVLVPAIVLTYLLDTEGIAMHAQYYAYWSAFEDHPVGRILYCLSFLNEMHAKGVSLFTNSPVWSLGYEVPYYIIFGILTFLRGWKRIAMLLVSLAIWGLPVFSLLPLWLAGTWFYKRMAREQFSKAAGIAALVGIIPILAVTFLVNRFWRPYENLSSQHLVSLSGVKGKALEVLSGDIFAGRSSAFPLLYGVGSVTLCLFVFVDAYREEVRALLRKLAAPIRTFASATFSIYLFHFPILCFVASQSFYRRESKVENCFLALFALAICFLLSRVTEAKKDVWRNWIDRAIGVFVGVAPRAKGIS